MPYSSKKYSRTQRELESISTKPNVIDDLLSDYYNIEIIETPIRKWQNNASGFFIHLNKDFFTSIFTSKKDRIKYDLYKDYLTYKFTIRFRPEKKYIKHLEGVYKLVPYNMSLPELPSDNFECLYLYFNSKKNEFLSAITVPNFNDDMKKFLYDNINKNTTIFQSKKMYNRIVDEIGKKLNKISIERLVRDYQSQGISGGLDTSKTNVGRTEWDASEIYEDFLDDLESGLLPLTFKSYVGIEDDEIIG